MGTLKTRRGSISVSDNSAPEIIYGQFGVSKKIFKKTIGVLYKKRVILIESKGIRVIKKGEK